MLACRPNCCASISNSAICRRVNERLAKDAFKEKVLFLVTALAIIAILGAVLSTVASNADIGALNALATKKYVYISMLMTGCLLLALDIVSIAKQIRSYNHKQYTQQEVNALGIYKWAEENAVFSYLEKEHYIDFDNQIKTVDDQPVWGCIVKDSNGNLGVYAYREREDYTAQLEKLGYQNIIAAFENSDDEPPNNDSNPIEVVVDKKEYTREAIQRDPKAGLEFEKWEKEQLDRGKYRVPQATAAGFGTLYPLAYNRKGETEVRVFTTPQYRTKALNRFIENFSVETKSYPPLSPERVKRIENYKDETAVPSTETRQAVTKNSTIYTSFYELKPSSQGGSGSSTEENSPRDSGEDSNGFCKV